MAEEGEKGGIDCPVRSMVDGTGVSILLDCLPDGRYTCRNKRGRDLGSGKEVPEGNFYQAGTPEKRNDKKRATGIVAVT